MRFRREEERRLKKVMESNPERRVPRGKPKQRWWNPVKADIGMVGAAGEDTEYRPVEMTRTVGGSKYQLRCGWPWRLSKSNSQVL